MDIQPNARMTVWQRAAPALLMMLLAPTFTELLLGGTRLSTLIAFPPVLLMEILVWGGWAPSCCSPSCSCKRAAGGRATR